MKFLIYAVGILALILTACEASKTNTPKPPIPTATQQAACTDAEFDQLDFWVGDWDMEWDLPDGKIGTGRNTISETPYGNCVITEKFDGAPTMTFKGMSVSTYHKPSGQWRQTWVDDQGGYFALSGGPMANDTFTLTMTRLADKGPYRRMVWSDITENTLTWSWQGHNPSDEEEWKDLWVIRYTRRP